MTDTPSETNPALGEPSGDAGDIEARDGTQGTARSWLALAAILIAVGALVAGAVAVSRTDGGTVAVGGGGAPTVLRLLRGGAASEKSAAGAMAPTADAMLYQEVEYRLEGTLPDLGRSAPVYRLVAPAMDSARVATMARALGIASTPRQQGTTWEATGADRSLYVAPVPGGWAVSIGGGGSAGGGTVSSPPSVGGSSSGSSGSGSGSASPGEVAPSGSSGGTSAGSPGVAADPDRPTTPAGEPIEEGESPDAGPRDAGVPTPMPEPTMPQGPKNLPDAARAEQIARGLLHDLGVLDSEFTVSVSDGAAMGYAVACAADGPCPDTSTTSVVLTRSVRFDRMVDGIRVEHLGWSVEVGDEGRVESAYGTLAGLAKVADYPLRSAKSAYDDLVAGTTFFPGPMPMAGDAVGVAVGAPVAKDGGGPGVPDIAVPSPEPAPDIAPAPDNPPGGSSDPSGGVDGTAPAGCPPVTADPSGREPAIACHDPAEGPVAPSPLVDPPIAPVATVVVVTGAALGAAVVPALDGADAVSYVVPTYRFTGRYERGGEWSTDVLGIDPALVAPTDPVSPTEPTNPVAPTEPVDPAEPPPANTIVPNPVGPSAPPDPGDGESRPGSSLAPTTLLPVPPTPPGSAPAAGTSAGGGDGAGAVAGAGPVA